MSVSLHKINASQHDRLIEPKQVARAKTVDFFNTCISDCTDFTFHNAIISQTVKNAPGMHTPISSDRKF